MQLPFTKKAKAPANTADQVIDVKVKTVKPPKASKAAPAVALPKVATITKELLPSFDRTNRVGRLQLSPAMRVFPLMVILGAAGSLAAAGWMIYTQRAIKEECAALNKQIESTQKEAMGVAEQLGTVEARFKIAAQILTWTDHTTAFEPVLVSVAEACRERVQLNTLVVEQKDHNSLRLTLTFQATGDPKKFDGVQQDLLRSLDKLGWQTEPTPTVNGPQLNFIGTLTRNR